MNIMLDSAVSYREPISMPDPAQSASRQLPLTKLAKGTRARILSLRELDSFGINDESVSQRLKELGFLPGATLTVIGFGLFGSSPIAVQINGTKFALRTAEASKIIVEPLQS